MKRFNELLKFYRNGTATKAEKEELFTLLQTGEYDHLLDSHTQEMLEAEQEPASEEENVLSEKIYDRILYEQGIEPEKIVPIHRERSRWWMAAAAVILIGVAATVWTVTTTNLSAPEKQANASVHTGKQVIYLPDGTQVILNENSELTYDDSFGISDRKVSLVGEATFDVKHDPSKEFIVSTGKVATKVLGTAFNINAFPERQQVTVTVLRGLVQVEDDKQLLGKIAPDEQIEVNVKANAFVRKKVKAEEVVAWQNGFLILDDVALEEAARIIGDKFGVKITFEDPALKKCLFHATFLNDENLSDVLAMMSTVVNVNHTMEEDGSVVIRGKGCN